MPYGLRAPFLSLLSVLVCGLLHAQGRRAAPATAPALSAEETDGLVERIRRQEYRFEAVKNERDTWSAPNRAQGLRSRVSERGLEVFPRATGADGKGALWKLALATTSFGRADGSFELPRASVSAAGERVELDHGYLVEWFVNDERGIEQGWTIPERLIGSEALAIGLAIEGELSLRIEEGGRSGVLVDPCGEAVLRYRDLRAFDATGRELDARIVPTPTGIAIEVEDTGAAYPLTVDPLLTDPAWIVESDQAEDGFGGSLATAGDVNGDGYADVIIGAWRYDAGQTDEGRAFVFHGSASGLDSSPAWMAESNIESATFGFAVSTAGDVNGDGYSDVIVGAPFWPFFDDEGRAYVYHGGSGGLAPTPAWTVQGQPGSEYFGYSVSTIGDMNGDGYSDVALTWGDSFEFEDHLFVYRGSAAGLSVTPDVDLEASGFVSTAGDVNGDGYSDLCLGTYGGAAVLFGAASGFSDLWTFQYPLEFPVFGYPTLMSTSAGDVNGDGYGDVVVLVYQYINPSEWLGEAFAFYGSASGLPSEPDWTVSPFQFEEILGGSVCSAGDVDGDGYSDVILGAIEYDGVGAGESRAFLYHGGSGGLELTPEPITDPGHPNAFGFPVSTAGDVNGDGYSDVMLSHWNDVEDEGSVRVYHGAAGGLSSSAAWSAESNQDGAKLGSVASAGDVNGDGYSDVIVGAPSYDGGEEDEGRAFVYHGSPSGPSTSPDWTAEPDQLWANFGLSVSTAGDVNGDGYSDVIVGADRYDGVDLDEGRAFAYLGSASGLATSPAWNAGSNQGGALFGVGVASAGDVNGDGYSDVIVGAPFFNGGQPSEGRAYAYLGSASGLATSPAWTVESNQAFSNLGQSVATAGDVNGDGYADVLVSVHGYDAPETAEGRAYAYHGSASGLATSPSWTVESNLIGSSLGFPVSTAGDVNGDGYSDVLIGAVTFSNPETWEGRAFAYHGSASGLSTSPAWSTESNQVQAFLGFVATAGDVNADGYSDVLVSAIQYDGGEEDEGRAYAYMGSASGLAANPAWTVESDQDGALLGPIASAGDVNGDGYSDVIVGASSYDGGEADEGRVWVYLGNDGRGGMVQGIQQRTSDGQDPLSLQGSAGVSGAFQIHAEFPTSAAPGASTAQLEWEVKPMGVPFDGQGIESGTPQPLGPGGGPLVFDELVTPADVGRAFLTRAGLYRWRARIATDDPLRPHTPWFSVSGNALTEAKVRKAALRFP